jgi:hypothetical protein
MTWFGWVSVILWAYTGFTTKQRSAQLLCLIMITLTLAVGTGNGI